MQPLLNKPEIAEDFRLNPVALLNLPFWFPEKQLTLLVGYPGSGKSVFAMSMARALNAHYLQCGAGNDFTPAWLAGIPNGSTLFLDELYLGTDEIPVLSHLLSEANQKQLTLVLSWHLRKPLVIGKPVTPEDVRGPAFLVNLAASIMQVQRLESDPNVYLRQIRQSVPVSVGSFTQEGE